MTKITIPRIKNFIFEIFSMNIERDKQNFIMIKSQIEL